MTTIRQQLTRRLLLGMGSLLLVGAAVVYGTTRTALTRQFDETLRAQATALASAVEEDNGRIVVDSADDIVREFNRPEGGTFFQVWGTNGAVDVVSPSLRDRRLPWPASHLASSGCWNTTLTGGLAIRAIALKFQPHPADEANVAHPASAPVETILVVAADRRHLNQSLTTLAVILAGSSLLVLMLTGGLVPLLLRRELAPLEALAGQAQRITAESLATRFATDGLPGELTPISTRLNDLLQRLQAAFARERQFSDDLAHELRTPIAELRSLAELARKWPEERNDDQVLAIALQMESIVTRLLALARVSQGSATTEVQPVNLTGLVEAVARQLDERRANGRLSFQFELPPALTIQSDPTLVRAIVTNLLDNAVEYSAPDTTVKIVGTFHNHAFQLHFTNTVRQLDAADVPHLFERFWRKDAARTGGDHAGLGLPLARALATSLGCTLTAALNETSQLTLTFSGPTETNRTAGPI